MNDDFISAEIAGAKAGINPLLGEWKQRFDFKPIGRQAKLEVREKYTDRISVNGGVKTYQMAV